MIGDKLTPCWYATSRRRVGFLVSWGAGIPVAAYGCPVSVGVVRALRDRVQSDRRKFHMTLPPWADRRKGTRSDLEALFATSAAAGWAANNTQPISALVRPPAPDEESTPRTDIAAVEDLDALSTRLAR